MAELVIVFREVLEGALIVGILYTYLNKTEQYGDPSLIEIVSWVLVSNGLGFASRKTAV